MPKRIEIKSKRAIKLYNSANNTNITTAEELFNVLGCGRTSGAIKVIDLNKLEKNQLAGANFFKDSMKHPPIFSDSCCLLGAIKEIPVFWIGEC